MIELLVVVTLIALLIAFLLPSLKSAREKTRMVTCMAHTSAIGRAAATYTADAKGWLCGSPGTSGSVMFGTEHPAPEDENIATNPSQIWDYAGALAATYMKASVPANRAERMRQVVGGVFACPSNSFFANPWPHPVGSFKTQPMTSYNTFRNFLLWPRTMENWNPSRPWGPKAPFPQASFDTIGGRTLTPKNHRPNIDRITNPAGKAYLADGNRFTSLDDKVTYDLEWDAEAGGAFCNGGPTLPEGAWPGWETGDRLVLSSYHYDKQLGRYGYRHFGSKQRGIVVNFLDGHSDFLTEDQSREPDFWWPKGTTIPFSEFNAPTKKLVAHRINPMNPYYRVGR